MYHNFFLHDPLVAVLHSRQGGNFTFHKYVLLVSMSALK